jgi:serine/threonine protein kinase
MLAAVVIRDLVDLLNTGHELAEKVDANKQQCKQIANRLSVFVPKLEELEDNGRKKRRSSWASEGVTSSEIEVGPARQGILNLREVAQDTFDLIDEFSRAYKGPYEKRVGKFIQFARRAYSAKTHEKEFRELHLRIDRATQDLSLVVAFGSADVLKQFQDALKNDQALMLKQLREGLKVEALPQSAKLSIQGAIQEQEGVPCATGYLYPDLLEAFEYARKEQGPFGISEDDKDHSVLGRGTFGVIHLMRSLESESKVAPDQPDQTRPADVCCKQIQVFTKNNDTTIADAFRSEANTLFGLKHENIIGYLGLYQTRNAKELAMVMEFAGGGTLAARVQKEATAKHARGATAVRTRLRPDEKWLSDAKTWLTQIFSALDYMHRLYRTLHRDLKPQNIMLTTRASGIEQVKIIDLGTARTAATNATKTSKSGTTSYMSPEKARGRNYDRPDDIWAAGCIVVELVTMQLITENGFGAGLWSQSQETLTLLIMNVKEVDSLLGEIAAAALQSDPAARLQAVEVKDALDGKFDGHVSEIRREPMMAVNGDAGQELLEAKLASPEKMLRVDESIDVLMKCLEKGEDNTARIQDTSIVCVIGNTGSGKSTFINSVCGCKMVEKKRKAIGLKGTGSIILVDGPAAVAKTHIGHEKNKSATFLPIIVTTSLTTPKLTSATITYCDLPGFLDNRGAEINIANAVNTRMTLMKASSVKIVALVAYDTINSDRGHGLTAMLKILKDMFSSDETVQDYGAILLGVTKFPLNYSLEDLKEEILEMVPHSEMVKQLTERLFVYDPLDRDYDDKKGLKKQEIVERIVGMTPITDTSSVFKTVLLDSDEVALTGFTEAMHTRTQEHLLQGEWAMAGQCIARLSQLTAINHVSVERHLQGTHASVRQHFIDLGSEFKNNLLSGNFEDAEQKLTSLHDAVADFDQAVGQAKLATELDVDELDLRLKQARAQAEEKKGMQTELVKKDSELKVVRTEVIQVIRDTQRKTLLTAEHALSI